MKMKKKMKKYSPFRTLFSRLQPEAQKGFRLCVIVRPAANLGALEPAPFGVQY